MIVDPDTRVYEHVTVSAGVAYIAGTRYKVSHLAAERLAYGWSAEELQFQHPDLTLGQVYAALAYYADHRQVLDDLIDKEWSQAQRERALANDSVLRQKLRAKGLLK